MSFRIGVVVPAFNVEALITECLRSLQAQTYRNWTTIVVDDGSSDTTFQRAREFADPRITALRQDNAGVSTARNRGLAALPSADGVLFLDADDYLAPTALARLIEVLAQEPKAVASAGPARFVCGDTLRPLSLKPAPQGDVLKQLLVRNLFVNGGHILIRRAAVERAGSFTPSLRYGEDWDYWTRLALLGPFVRTAGRDPVLFVRRLATGAYRRMASDPASFQPCMDAIFANPGLRDRLSRRELTRLRTRAEAENNWIIGRALLAGGHHELAGRYLRRSVARAPSAKRIALLAAAHIRPLWRAIDSGFCATDVSPAPFL